MVIKVYVAMISCSQEIKKNQQRTIMILDSKNISYIAIDITDPANEDSKDFFLATAQPKEGSKIPITPQIFNEENYCGDYDGLDMANECDTLSDFLGLNDNEKANVKVGITGNENASEAQNVTNEVTVAATEDGAPAAIDTPIPGESQLEVAEETAAVAPEATGDNLPEESSPIPAEAASPSDVEAAPPVGSESPPSELPESSPSEVTGNEGEIVATADESAPLDEVNRVEEQKDQSSKEETLPSENNTEATTLE